jgi:exopolyphosphatase / guanosine-5'-triphosphate,3'-diphosphate pyrophosphatase
MLQNSSDKIGIIDLGTNTFNLLVAQKIEGNNFSKLFAHRVPVMLGEKTISSDIIGDAAFDRGIKAMVEFAEILRRLEVNNVRALATSALRTSKNALDFVNKAHDKTGIKINVITGGKEAELIFKGNSVAARLDDNYSLIVDIGGGSTEFIIGNKNGIHWKKSYLLGAARLLSKFMPGDPIADVTIKDIEQFFDSELTELFNELKKVNVIEMIGSSGAFDSFVEMIDIEFSSMNFNEKRSVYVYNLPQYYHIADKILKSKLEERLNMKGLIPMRAEMIVLSVIITSYVLKRIKVSALRSTTWSLKEGAVLEWIEEMNA